MTEEKINYICIHCGNPLIGKQQKYCSEKCGKRHRNKKHNHERWRKIHGRIKANKLKKKQKRKELMRQEMIKRDGGC